MTVFFAGDFETTTSPEQTEVWLSCLVNVEKYNDKQAYKVNENIKDFLKTLYIETLSLYRQTGERDFIVFFHNLKFDGSFLLNFFLENLDLMSNHNNMINFENLKYSSCF